MRSSSHSPALSRGSCALTLAVLAACQSQGFTEIVYGPDGAIVGDSAASSQPDARKTTTDASGGTDGGSKLHESDSGTCIGTCETDLECANGCVAHAGTINCCDLAAKACFVSSATLCPDGKGGTPTGDGGGSDGGTCGTDLSHVGTGNFTIRYKVTTTAQVLSALAGQRSSCNMAAMWDTRMLANGLVSAEFSDGVHYQSLVGTAAINDGAEHTIALIRYGALFTLLVDQVPPGVSAPDPGVRFGALAPLTTGTDACDGAGGTAPLVGTVSDVCITP